MLNLDDFYKPEEVIGCLLSWEHLTYEERQFLIYVARKVGLLRQEMETVNHE